MDKWESVEIEPDLESLEILKSEDSTSNAETPEATREIMEEEARRKTRCWIASVLILAMLLFVFAFGEGLWQVMGSWDWGRNSEFFESEFRAALLLNEDHIPVILIVVLSALTLSGFATMFYVSQPASRSSYLWSQRISKGTYLLVLLTMVFQLWTFTVQFPGEAQRQRVEGVMKHELLQSVVNGSESVAWAATQRHYECCGINSPKDWLHAFKGKKHVYHDRLPASCCCFRHAMMSISAQLKEKGHSPHVYPEDSVEDSQKVRTMQKEINEIVSSWKCLPEHAYNDGCVAKIFHDIQLDGLRILADLFIGGAALLLMTHLSSVLHFKFHAALNGMRNSKRAWDVVYPLTLRSIVFTPVCDDSSPTPPNPQN